MNLIFIRHAASKQEPGKPASQWGLTEEGRAQCRPLGENLRSRNLARIYASEEPKAHQTAVLAAGVLGIPVEIIPGLHEHERNKTPFFATQKEFVDTVIRAFEYPDRLILGEETMNQCLARFDAAVRHVIGIHEKGNIAIASHGTVISLFVAKYNPVSPVRFWQNLKMPDVVTLKIPGFLLVQPSR